MKLRIERWPKVSPGLPHCIAGQGFESRVKPAFLPFLATLQVRLAWAELFPSQAVKCFHCHLCRLGRWALDAEGHVEVT